MKALDVLDIFLTLAMWMLIGLAIYALWPWLLKLLVAAQTLHNLGLH